MRAAVPILILAIALGCRGGGDRPPADAPPPLPDTAVSATPSNPASAAPSADTSAAPVAAGPTTSGPKPAGPPDTTPSPRQDTSVWSAGVVAQAHPGPTATLAGIRVARHPGFERVVFEFRDRLPSYQAEYVDRPVRACGSGNVVPILGDGWLQVRFREAQAHDERGRATVPRKVPAAGLANLVELRSTCDFEGELTWVLGLKHPNRYRTLELQSPARLVVDVLN